MTELCSCHYRNVKDVKGNYFRLGKHMSINVISRQLFSVHLRPELFTCFVKFSCLRSNFRSNFCFLKRGKCWMSSPVCLWISSVNQLSTFNDVRYEGHPDVISVTPFCHHWYQDYNNPTSVLLCQMQLLLMSFSSNAVVPKRCVARDHEVCREIKKYIFKLILIMIKNWTND
jgi:hypothetical protein